VCAYVCVHAQNTPEHMFACYSAMIASVFRQTRAM
jgi:hypothetical protein